MWNYEDETIETSLMFFGHVVKMLQRCAGIDNILRIGRESFENGWLLTDLFDDVPNIKGRMKY